MRKNLILGILIVIFALPGISAWLLYNHPHWLTASTTNKGRLLDPPELMTNLGSQPKWRLILWQKGDCDKRCLAQLDRLARIRLALGRRLYEVDEVLLLPEQSHIQVAGADKVLQEQDIRVVHLPAEKQTIAILANKSSFFIASPDNYLVLNYPLQVKSDAVYHDIKKLLNNPASR